MTLLNEKRFYNRKIGVCISGDKKGDKTRHLYFRIGAKCIATADASCLSPFS